MTAKDTHPNKPQTLESPATRHYAVTPDDVNDLPILPLKLYVETGGAVVIEDADGHAETYTVPDHSIIEFRATKVRQTGTNALGIKAWY